MTRNSQGTAREGQRLVCRGVLRAARLERRANGVALGRTVDRVLGVALEARESVQGRGKGQKEGGLTSALFVVSCFCLHVRPSLMNSFLPICAADQPNQLRTLKRSIGARTHVSNDVLLVLPDTADLERPARVAVIKVEAELVRDLVGGGREGVLDLAGRGDGRGVDGGCDERDESDE